jgi:hypothetical protein
VSGGKSTVPRTTASGTETMANAAPGVSRPGSTRRARAPESDAVPGKYVVE